MQDELWTSSDEQRLEQLYWEKSGKFEPVGPCCEWPHVLSKVLGVDWEKVFSCAVWAVKV